MTKSKIEWTEHTWNPVTGCDRISPGCKNCYALAIAERFRGTAAFPNGFDVMLRPEKLEVPIKRRKPTTYFVNSMSDLFHPDIADDYIDKVFRVMEQCDRHRFQILTKRPERMGEFCRDRTLPKNIWLGVSVESQSWNWRVDCLRQIECAIRFLSCEPLLGQLDLDLSGVNWVIVGGESGPTSRAIDPDWVRSIRDQCQSSQTAFFFKQWGGKNKQVAGNELDGRQWLEMPRELCLEI